MSRCTQLSCSSRRSADGSMLYASRARRPTTECSPCSESAREQTHRNTGIAEVSRGRKLSCTTLLSDTRRCAHCRRGQHRRAAGRAQGPHARVIVLTLSVYWPDSRIVRCAATMPPAAHSGGVSTYPVSGMPSSRPAPARGIGSSSESDRLRVIRIPRFLDVSLFFGQFVSQRPPSESGLWCKHA